ncbi:H+-transporting two-sector ATPase, E subunit [Ignicoccus hospitalis KIN4/I]|uniref:A-type ATP synthase subunit E n=1 Tax=Ignicoccus hospitalis (strain KIN4/I / DSM 18386 / JCM 14125) TaxID=453591 RepID=AATE_IGNH4|nr:RecName: Full=V-type ATP synthase subunit E; AltName: Full=V-ATPase subunit E [Ignicoccus hospitalis KIN4/I]ABU82257.1 H+-transporting two-sector ATPase, E subunit [Ignicoccus hospitalis KIN4/I]HIH90824.1 V-type ATP synthase subunit E [Desulfurococcaceae archaeon]
MVKVEFAGDVKNLTSYIEKDAKAKIDSVVEEAVKEAEKLLNEKKEELLERAVVDVEKLLSDAQARLSAEKSSIDMEVRRKVEERKKELFQKVVEEAWKRALEEAEKKTERYKKFLEKVLIAMSNEAGEDEVIAYVRADDLEDVRAMVQEKGLKNVVEVKDVKEVGREIKGGVLGKSKSGGVWYNYTLEKAFDELLREVYPKVLEALGF